MAVWRCSHKKATVLLCIFNAAAVLYVMNAVFGDSASPPAIPWHRRQVLGYTPQEANRILESHEIRRKAQSNKLIERMKKIQVESDQNSSELDDLTAKETTELVERLRQIQNNETSLQGLSEWRKKMIALARGLNYTAECDMTQQVAEEEVKKLMELGWFTAEPPGTASEPEGTGEELPTVTSAEVEDGIIPGKLVPPQCHAEAHTDFDGVAVRWGLTHHTDSAADCCQACLDQAKSAKPGELKCNVWVFCAAENGCYSPDIYEHKHQECWLKQADQPKLNFKGHYHEEYRQTHPNAPVIVPWVSGFTG